VNDRALRETVVGLGGASNGPPREATFRITAASEVMAILCLATDVADLRDRLARAIVARTRDGDPVTVAALGVAGAATALLTDALRPNLVQTIEGSPAFVHGGPFANIAHGTSSVLADHLGRRLADVVVTEAGFGADLGAEKFLDIVARDATLAPDATVLVATVDALLAHGGVDDREATPADARTEAIRRGLANLDHHVDVLRSFGLPVVVALNRFPLDTDAEVDVVLDHCESRGVPAAVSTVHADGGAGGVHLARLVREATRESTTVEPLYDLSASLREKLATVATEVYGADGVAYSDDALAALDYLEAAGLADRPVCVSKAPTSLSEDPDRTGVPEGWTLHVRDLYPAAGAGFVVALTGDVVTMPGLPAHPAALDIDVTPAGDVTGLF
jgi:formate--tetrahydrofolate ligase